MTSAPGSEAHLDLVKELYTSFSEADFSPFRRILSPSVSLRFFREAQQKRVLTGLGRCIEYLEELRSEWSDVTVVIREFLSTDDMVASNGLMLLYPSPGGQPTVREFAHEWTFAVMRVVAFTDITPLLADEVREQQHDD